MNKVAFLFLAFSLVLTSCCGDKSSSNAFENETIQSLLERRSIRTYKPQAVDRKVMDRIAYCGINAPNGMNAQNWQIRLVDDPEYINGITALYVASMKEDPRGAQMVEDPSFKNMFRNAPTVAFIATANGQSLIDCGLLAGNMVNAAQSLGIGSVCLGGPVRFMNTPVAAEYVAKLKFPENYQLVLAIGFGYPDETPDAKPRDAKKIQWIN